MSLLNPPGALILTLGRRSLTPRQREILQAYADDVEGRPSYFSTKPPSTTTSDSNDSKASTNGTASFFTSSAATEATAAAPQDSPRPWSNPTFSSTPYTRRTRPGATRGSTDGSSGSDSGTSGSQGGLLGSLWNGVKGVFGWRK